MDKVKIYKICGNIFILLALVTSALINYTIFFHIKRGGYPLIEFSIGAFILNNIKFLLINPFLFMGAIFLWRAEKNRIPLRTSKWLIFVVLYSIGLILFIISYAVFCTKLNKELNEKHKVIEKMIKDKKIK